MDDFTIRELREEERIPLSHCEACLIADALNYAYRMHNLGRPEKREDASGFNVNHYDIRLYKYAIAMAKNIKLHWKSLTDNRKDRPDQLKFFLQKEKISLINKTYEQELENGTLCF